MNSKTPKYRFPEFIENWQKITLNRALETDAVKNSKGKYQKEDMLSVSSSAGVVNQMEYHGRSYAGKSVLPYNILKKGQIVYTKSPLRDYPYGIIKYNTHADGIVSTLYAVYSVKKEHSGEFIDYYFQLSERQNRYLKPLVNIGAKNDMKVNNNKVLIDPVIFPQLKEQQKVASFFSVIDEKIQALKNKKELLEEYKKGIAQKLFSKDLQFKDEKGNSFSNWEKLKLIDIATRKTTKNLENNNNVLTISAQHGLISQLEYFNKSVSASNVTGYYLIEKDDFAYNKSYSNGYPTGAIKRLNRYKKGVVSTLYICFAFKQKIDMPFMEQYFDAGIQNAEIQKVAQEGARNHGLLNIGVSDFFDIPINIPSSSQEKAKIAQFLSSIDQKIEIIQMQLSRAW